MDHTTIISTRKKSSRIPKRLLSELKILTIDPDVQSYFHYESLENDDTSGLFYIYGYLTLQKWK